MMILIRAAFPRCHLSLHPLGQDPRIEYSMYGLCFTEVDIEVIPRLREISQWLEGAKKTDHATSTHKHANSLEIFVGVRADLVPSHELRPIHFPFRPLREFHHGLVVRVLARWSLSSST